MNTFYFEDKINNFGNENIEIIEYTFVFKQMPNSIAFPTNCLIIYIKAIHTDKTFEIGKIKKDFENLEWSEQDVFVTEPARVHIEKLIKNRMFW